MHADLVDQYLQALGLQRQAPDGAYLAQITQRHVATLPFASIGPRLGNDLPLDLPALCERLLVRRRGGYCFEQNALLFGVLEALGFTITLVLARVLNNQDIHPGLTHRSALVDLAGVRYLVDVGFGPNGPRVPVPLSGQPLQDRDRCFKVSERRTGEFHLQVLKADGYYSLYGFELARYGAADCALGHFYSHRHPDAVFVNTLVASRILAQEIRSLRNRDYRIITGSGETQRHVATAECLQEILTLQLDLCVTESETRQLFQQLP